MKALILCAGYATRLYPLTKNKPKALLEVKGKKIIDYIVENIQKIPLIDEILVVTNNRFSLAFEQWADENSFSKKVIIVNDSTMSEEDKLGAVGDINFVIKEQKISEDLMVIAGDNLFEYSLSNLCDFFAKKNASVIACRKFESKEELAKNYGVVELDSKNLVNGFEEKPENPKTLIGATGCYVLKKNDLDLLEPFLKDQNPDNSGEFIKYLSIERKVFGLIFSEKWFDIGSFEALGKAREEFNGA